MSLIKRSTKIKAYILKRLLLLVPLFLGITVITFALIKALPGDPVLSIVGERTSPETSVLLRVITVGKQILF